MSKPSQGLRALASLLEAVTPELSAGARTALGEVAGSLHQAADLEAVSEVGRLGGPAAGPVLATFAEAMVDGFFALLGAHGAPASPAAPTAVPVAG